MQGHQYIFMIPACSCSRAFQAKEMAELNAPFVLPGEEIRVPLKATRPTDTRAASDIFEAWGLSEDHIQIFGQPQSACIMDASAADSSGTNYFEANFDVFRTLPPGEDATAMGMEEGGEGI